jgi:HSP20 family protein
MPAELTRSNLHGWDGRHKEEITMAVLERWSPFRELEMMEQRMRRLLPALSAEPTVAPAADIYEADGEIVVELEVPGYEEKELDIEVKDRTLTIKGHRASETEKTEKKLRLHERLEATFERSFELPAEADVKGLKATYGTGVLTLHVPKAPQATPLRIPIEAS